jgi:lysine 2,3-aminomutase
MRAFVETRIRPYYLHHPDLAPGTSHFRLSIEEGQALIRQLRARASGLCQPEYVLDIPGGYAKARLAPSDIDAGGLRDHDSRWHPYPPVNIPAAGAVGAAEQAAARIQRDARDTMADYTAEPRSR